MDDMVFIKTPTVVCPKCKMIVLESNYIEEEEGCNRCVLGPELKRKKQIEIDKRSAKAREKRKNANRTRNS